MTIPKLILTVGIPGSGKTTYAKRYIQSHENTIHLSSDSIRKELYGDESIQGNPGEVFELMQCRTLDALKNGVNVVYDATNITRKDRSYIILLCPKFVQIEAHIVWAPIKTCIERDAARERTVGKEVIDKMLKRFQAPYYDEGIDTIEVVFPYNFDTPQYFDECKDAMNIPHDNPHHTLNIHEHCYQAYRYMQEKTSEYNLALTAYWHDIGKPYTKEFKDTHGNPSEHAHYYQHHTVGAWMAYGLKLPVDAVWLISTHMDPFLNTKYYNNLPPFLKQKVDLLHEADLAAH